MSDYYERWNDKDCVQTFATKMVNDFFASEVHHLQGIISEIQSILDIGCASGKFVDLLRNLGADPKYVGIDISPSNIENARRLYPDLSFHHANALDFKSDETFDLVNATGVCQHEPDFEKLIQKMTDLSNKYVLFDVKLAKTENAIIDIEQSYAGSDENRLYFIVLNIDKLIDLLSKIENVSKISIFGYQTQLNTRTHVPSSIDSVVSAGVLLTLQKDARDPVTIERHVPEDLL